VNHRGATQKKEERVNNISKVSKNHTEITAPANGLGKKPKDHPGKHHREIKKKKKEKFVVGGDQMYYIPSVKPFSKKVFPFFNEQWGVFEKKKNQTRDGGKKTGGTFPPGGRSRNLATPRATEGKRSSSGGGGNKGLNVGGKRGI